jgi:hypothetical protein
MSNIFVITMVDDENENRNTVGISTDRKTALEWATNNTDDIFENHKYKYCVVEEYEEGVYPKCVSEAWFKRNWSITSEQIPKPKEYRNIVNWGIG